MGRHSFSEAAMKLFVLLLLLTVTPRAVAQAPVKQTLKVPRPLPASPELLARGQKIYTTYCVRCHGAGGAGDGVAAKVINPKPRNFTKDDFKYGGNLEQLFATITSGIEGTAMPSWAYLSEKDRWAVLHYVLTFRPKAN